jgi:hypothetical protein
MKYISNSKPEIQIFENKHSEEDEAMVDNSSGKGQDEYDTRKQHDSTKSL